MPFDTKNITGNYVITRHEMFKQLPIYFLRRYTKILKYMYIPLMGERQVDWFSFVVLEKHALRMANAYNCLFLNAVYVML
jgi:hypothetical protein